MEKKEFLKRINSKPLSQRAKPDLSLIDEDARKIPFIIVSDKNEGERYDWWEGKTYIEKLDVNGARFDELKTFFKDHDRSVDTAIGRVENTRIENGQVKADVYFGSDEDSIKIFNKYREGILTDVSIGYSIADYVEEVRKDEPTIITVTDYSIKELSAVWKGFDTKATIGREAEVEVQEPKKPVTPESVKRRFRIIASSRLNIN